MVPPSVFRLLAHELRSPAAVISGYARMLREGRLDEAARAQALAQIERAGNRISIISRQASDLGRWLAAEPRALSPGLTVRALVTRAIAESLVPDMPIEVDPEAEPLVVMALDSESLPEALRSIIDALSRETMDDPVRVVVRAIEPPSTCDIVVAPASRVASRGALDDGGEERVTFAPDRGGHGLSLVLAAAVLSAHQSRLWTAGDPPGIVRIRLLTAPGQVAGS